MRMFAGEEGVVRLAGFISNQAGKIWTLLPKKRVRFFREFPRQNRFVLLAKRFLNPISTSNRCYLQVSPQSMRFDKADIFTERKKKSSFYLPISADLLHSPNSCHLMM